MKSRYDYRNHMGSDHDIVAIVPDELVTKKAVAGTPAQCTRLLQMAIDEGYRKVALFPFGDVDTVLRRLAREVLPSLSIPSHSP